MTPRTKRVGDFSASLRKFFKKYKWAFKAAGFAALYAAWVAAFRLLALTFVTYFLMASSPNAPRFEEVGDTLGSSELSFMGLAALLFVLGMKWLNPLTSTTGEEIFSPRRFDKKFLPGFQHGAVLAFGVALAFLLSGLYRYLGFFIQEEEVPLAIANIVLRVAGLGLLAYCEEFIFRRKLAAYLDGNIPNWGIAAVTAFAFCGIKLLQFNLGWMQAFTLLLVSIALSLKAAEDGDFVRGAGFWAAMLILFHPLLSLPLLGNDFSGLLLVRYQVSDAGSSVGRFLSGGVGGPLSSFAFQVVIAFEIARDAVRLGKTNLMASALPNNRLR